MPKPEVSIDKARFQTLFESLPFSLQIYAPDGRCLLANKAWEELWGVPRSTLEGYNIFTDVHATRTGMGTLIRKAFEGEEIQLPPVYYDPVANGFRGNARWISTHLYPLQGPDGAVREVLLLIIDETERLRNERNVRQSRDQLEAILSSVTDGITVLDREGKFIYANEIGAKMCGFDTVGAFLAATTEEVMSRFEIRAEDGNLLDTSRLPGRRALAGERHPPELLIRYRSRGAAEWRWSLVSACPVFDADGKVEFAISVFRDFTEHRRMNEALRRSEEYFRRMAEASKALASSLDFETTLAALARMGVPDFADETAVDLFDDTSGPVPGEELTDRMIRVHLVARGRIMGRLSFRITGEITGGSRRPYGAEDLELARELARRASLALDNARLYREAQSSIRLRDEFLSIASHELRTPLTSLYMQLQLLEQRPGPAPADRIARATKQARRLGNLIDSLLDLSRLANGKLKIEPEPMDLVAVVDDLVARFRDEAAQAGSAISVRHGAPTLEGTWDRLRLEQAVTNLISNAIKYGNGKEISIETGTLDQGAAVLRVRDQGLGIAPADQARIFNRFERAISHNHITGLGLGLYITQQIMQAHGGTVKVESAPGQGSTFTLELPRV